MVVHDRLLSKGIKMEGICIIPKETRQSKLISQVRIHSKEIGMAETNIVGCLRIQRCILFVELSQGEMCLEIHDGVIVTISHFAFLLVEKMVEY